MSDEPEVSANEKAVLENSVNQIPMPDSRHVENEPVNLARLLKIAADITYSSSSLMIWLKHWYCRRDMGR